MPAGHAQQSWPFWVARTIFLLVFFLRRVFYPDLAQQAWHARFFLQLAFFHYRSFSSCCSAGLGQRCLLGSFVFKHQSLHFFQRLHFDLADALCAHAVFGRQLVQGRPARAIVIHMQPALF